MIYWHDFCRHCGEYVHDDHGHMCPDTKDKYRRILAEIAYRQADKIADLERQLSEPKREAGK